MISLKLNLIRDGKVAVVYSPGYGAGISTWSPDSNIDPADGDVARLVDEGKIDDALAVLKQRYPDVYIENQELDIEWVPQGRLYRINEYDGSESVEVFDAKNWRVA